jgi:serine/threonine protein kinase
VETIMSANTCPDARQLQQLLLAGLPTPQAEVLEEHLLGCTACCATARGLAGTDTLVDALRSNPTLADEPESELIAAVVSRLGFSKQGETASPTAALTASELEAADHAYLAAAQTPEELGWLGSYRVLSELGRGGMGVVFRAEDSCLKRAVALKVMRPWLAENPAARQRFVREAQAAASVTHANIIRIYQVSEDRGVPFLAMELLAGETVEQRLAREGRLPLADVLRVGREIAEGLAAAHEAGLVHRDIKPANVWLEAPAGRVKLLDFGLARAADDASRLTQTGAIIGTPGYIAPEQARGAAVDVRCDLFSLGCVLYQMCTGTAPFQGPNTLATLLAVALDQPAPANRVNPQSPAALSQLIARLLQKDPARRPRSAREVADALAALERGADVPTPPPAAPRRRRMVAVLVGLAAALLIGVFAFGTGTPHAKKNEPTQYNDAAVVAAKAADDKDKEKEDEKPARGYPVAIVAFEERGLGVKDFGAKIIGLLNAKLGEKEDIFLVDREDLKKSLDELALNISGVVKSNDANRVGQLTGARLLVIGSVFQDGKRLNIIAKIVGTETSISRSVSVEGKTGDELGPLVDKLATKVAELITKDGDKLVAKRAKEVDIIAELNKRLKGERPTLWISVGERHVGQPARDPAVQTELMRIARGAGFTVLDPDEAGKNRADIVITGEGMSELATRRDNLISVKARVELKVTERKTDKVITADRQTVMVVDLTEQIAGKTALQEAAAMLAERVLPKLTKP